MNPDDIPLSFSEVDCDGSACGSDRELGLHIHPPQTGMPAFGRVIVREGQITGHGTAEGITRLIMINEEEINP